MVWQARLGSATLMILMAGCSATPSTPVSPTPGEPDAAQAAVASKVVATMDRAVDPCQDFYRYACGGWLKRTKLPSDHARWVRSFDVITGKNLKLLRALLERPALAEQKPQQVYRACLDEATINARGLASLAPYRQVIDRVSSPEALMDAVGMLHADGLGALFTFYARPDARDPTTYVAYLSQGGLGLYSPTYYTQTDARSLKLLGAYTAHVAAMLGRAGVPEAERASRAQAVVAFERALALKSWERAQMRDPDKTYNKLSAADVQARLGALPLAPYLKRVGVAAAPESFIVRTLPFFDGLTAAVDAAGWPVVRDYLTWHLVRGAAGLLDAGTADESFAFYGKTLGGQQVQQARWKRCANQATWTVGELLGAQYVKEAFGGDSKARAQQLVDAVEGAFEDNLSRVSWMDETTRQRAKEKLHAIHDKIGHPDTPRDYPGVSLAAKDHFGNIIALRRAEQRRQLDRLGKPFDPHEWYMPASRVNAYYSASGNQIVFPAGILQPPFFDKDFPEAMSFGAIGMVIGHEITHGFDDQGRKFDAQGRLRPWWAPQTVARFEQKAACVDRLYSAVEVQPGLKINGKLTLGENIADMGGLKLAYQAYQRHKKAHAAQIKPSPVAGLSDDQLLFVAFAQTWCSISSPEDERRRLRTDSHSPPPQRVNVTVSTLPEFAQTFSCAPGTPMNPAPDQSCAVW